MNNLFHLMYVLFFRTTIGHNQFRPIVHIAPIPRQESKTVHLVAITHTGKLLLSHVCNNKIFDISCKQTAEICLFLSYKFLNLNVPAIKENCCRGKFCFWVAKTVSEFFGGMPPPFYSAFCQVNLNFVILIHNFFILNAPRVYDMAF